MPTYMTPGVYVEEVPSQSKPIEGVGTSIAAFVATAERGSAYTLRHPEFSVVVPQPRPLAVPLAYIIAALVVVQAGAIAYGVFGLFNWVEGGGTLDQAAFEAEGSETFTSASEP